MHRSFGLSLIPYRSDCSPTCAVFVSNGTDTDIGHDLAA